MPDQTTRDDTLRPPGPAAAPLGLRLVIAWHRDPARIGRMAWAPWARTGDTLDVSRGEPLFDDGAPLADAYVSRSPLQLVSTPDGLELWPGGGSGRFDLDRRPGIPGERVAFERVRAGFRLGVGRGALLHVQFGPRPQPRAIPTLLGASQELERLAATVLDVARVEGAVLVRGESGTGKELVSAAVHAHSRRAGKPFVAVNVAALPPSLAVAQLFGHTRGAFTGADRASPGYFGQADGGTLFLDEIGECPGELQALLLRALESGEIQVVGGPTRHVDVRVIAATDADLERACAERQFRAPLYHRLAHHTLRIPPLRSRPADIPLQAVTFAREAFAAQRGAWPPGTDGAPWLGREVMETLLDGGWPGNSRELKATMARLVARFGSAAACGAPELEGAAIPAPPTPASPSPHGTDASRLRAALAACEYRLETTAERLGISRNALKRRMEQEGIRRPVDYAREELAAALSAHGSLGATAQALGVSERGLKLRLGEVGLLWERS